jgi:hypothetical protein
MNGAYKRETAMRSLRCAVLLACFAPAALSAQKPRDLTKLDPCKVLASADIAAATKGKVSSMVGGGPGATACMWVVDAPTGAGTYQLFLQKADMIEALWKASSAAENGAAVPGLWTEAHLTPPGGMNGDQFILIALNRGDMAIEVHGVNKDAVVSLGKVAIARLK